MRLSLTYRLFAAIGLASMLVVVVMALLVAYGMREGFSVYLLKGELRRLDGLAETLAADYDSGAGGWPELEGDPRRWTDYVVRQTSPDGRAIPKPPPRGPRRPAPFAERLSLLDAQQQVIIGAPVGAAQVELLPILAPGADADAAPIGWLRLAAPGGVLSETDAFFLRGQITSLLLAASVALAVSAAVALLVARQFLAPIQALETGAKRLASGDYASRIPNDRRDELGKLIDHYNQLAQSLEASEIAQRQWMSDTSHELQTPLAVLRANIEALQDGVRTADARTLGAMDDAVGRLTRLIGDLRTLTHGHETGFAEARSTEDLGLILREAADVIAPDFSAAGLDLSVEAGEGVLMRCNAQRIRQVFDNLLGNALRYTDAPGRVVAIVEEDARQVRITVTDTPPAPPEEAMPHLFDRFFRAEASRSRAHGGSGLGLSICAAIVEGHGGKIHARKAGSGGLQIEILLPADGGTS
ncbi:ATP-binding protein [Tropicimonas aquimaris]|uniref:histidine kinase n=1 Tax=Tropicimonas aquimaris TaxID=914152 RepID=A0ABW3IRZ5_9RHOB